MKHIIISLTLALLITASAMAQENPPRVLVMGVPQYLIKNGIRIEVDIASNDYRSWWVISPQFYIDVSDIETLRDKNYEQLHGYGLAIHRKVFLMRNNTEKGAYFRGGLGYQYFNILTNSEHWTQSLIDGLNYLQLENRNYHVYINRAMADALIGFQKEITSRMYIDVYAGVGLRYSFHDQPSGSDMKFNKNISDFGYTGTAFVAGIRFGVGL